LVWMCCGVGSWPHRLGDMWTTMFEFLLFSVPPRNPIIIITPKRGTTCPHLSLLWQNPQRTQAHTLPAPRTTHAPKNSPPLSNKHSRRDAHNLPTRCPHAPNPTYMIFNQSIFFHPLRTPHSSKNSPPLPTKQFRTQPNTEPCRNQDCPTGTNMVFHYPQQTTLLCKTRIIGHMPTPSPHGASSKHGVQIGFSITITRPTLQPTCVQKLYA